MDQVQANSWLTDDKSDFLTTSTACHPSPLPLLRFPRNIMPSRGAGKVLVVLTPVNDQQTCKMKRCPGNQRRVVLEKLCQLCQLCQSSTVEQIQSHGWEKRHERGHLPDLQHVRRQEKYARKQGGHKVQLIDFLLRNIPRPFKSRIVQASYNSRLSGEFKFQCPNLLAHISPMFPLSIVYLPLSSLVTERCLSHPTLSCGASPTLLTSSRLRAQGSGGCLFISKFFLFLHHFPRAISSSTSFRCA